MKLPVEVHIAIARNNPRWWTPKGGRLLDGIESPPIEVGRPARTNDPHLDDSPILATDHDFYAHNEGRVIAWINRGKPVEPRQKLVTENRVDAIVNGDEIHREARTIGRQHSLVPRLYFRRISLERAVPFGQRRGIPLRSRMRLAAFGNHRSVLRIVFRLPERKLRRPTRRYVRRGTRASGVRRRRALLRGSPWRRDAAAGNDEGKGQCPAASHLTRTRAYAADWRACREFHEGSLAPPLWRVKDCRTKADRRIVVPPLEEALRPANGARGRPPKGPESTSSEGLTALQRCN